MSYFYATSYSPQTSFFTVVAATPEFISVMTLIVIKAALSQIVTTYHNKLCDGVTDLSDKPLNPLACAQQPPHIFKSCHAGGKGPSHGVPSHKFTSGYRKLIAKGIPYNPLPLTDRDGYYSRHACCEH